MPDKPPERLVTEERVPDETVIWRYFRYNRFVEILKTHKIWFARPYTFEDQWEGRFPPSYWRGTRQYAIGNNLDFDEFRQDLDRRLCLHRCGHFVSCWHMSEHESDAMWKLYALVNDGIAIQSTVGGVKYCLRPHGSGRVIYYDPSQVIRSPSIFGPHDILFKRNPFAWEQEYRLWYDDDDVINRIRAGEVVDEDSLTKGKLVMIDDMERMIKKIVVPPGVPDEFIERLRAACAETRKTWLGRLIERSYSDRLWEEFTA